MPLALLTAALVSTVPWGTGQSRGEDLTISLVTFSPGDDLFSWWGHTALVVSDGALRQERLYNYGMFGFDNETLWKFVRGRLEFWVGEDSAAGTFQLYRFLNRDVRVQELDLEPEERLRVAAALARNALPENRTYLYHHYDDNCATRPRDMIDLAVGGQLLAATAQPARMDLRHHTRRYSAVNAPMSLVLDYLQTHELDRPITQKEEAFLPDELERQVDALVVRRADGSARPLVKRKWVYFKSSRAPVPESPPNSIPALLALSFGLGGLALLFAARGQSGARWARRALAALSMLVGLVFGAFGLFLSLVWAFTDHEVAHHNENLLLINAAHLGLLWLGFRLLRDKPGAWRDLAWAWASLAGLCAVALALKVLPPFHQNNWNVIALVVPMTALAAFGLRKQLPAPASAAGRPS